MSASQSALSATRDNGPDSFICFPRLPPDIRIQIWEQAAHEPRSVDIWVCIPQDISGDGKFNNNATYRFATSQPPPSILQVNRESRDIGLYFYHLEFGTFGRMSYSRYSPRIYINFKSDIICPLGVFESGARGFFCARPIRHLALNVYDQCGLYTLHVWDSNVFDRLNDLEDLSLYWMYGWYEEKVLESYTLAYGSDTRTVDPAFNSRARLLLDFRDYGELESEDNFYGRGPDWQRVLHKFNHKISMDLNDRQKSAQKREAAQKESLEGALEQMSLSSAPSSVWSRPELKWMRVKVSLDSGKEVENEGPVVLEHHWRK